MHHRLCSRRLSAELTVLIAPEEHAPLEIASHDPNQRVVNVTLNGTGTPQAALSRAL
jgi:hypothetical protein